MIHNILVITLSVEHQSLLHNVLILGAVYNMDPEGSGDEPQCTMRKVVSALQDSFAHMSRGLRGVYDIRKIVGMLDYHSVGTIVQVS